MNRLSLLVGLKNNLDYSKHFYKTTRELYPTVEICFVSYGSIDGTHEWLATLDDNNVKYYYSTEQKTFSDTFNKASDIATKEYVAYLHNDIVLAPGFIENLEKHISRDNVISYTTVEPPIFTGHERPGKVIKDFGASLETFRKDNLFEFVTKIQQEYKNQTELGITFFMCLSREVLLSIGGLDNLYNPMFCEDDDLIFRLKLKQLNLLTSLDSICYHFVSKTSRFSDDYKNKTQQIEKNSNRNFIRKWGSRVPKVRYNIGFRILKCNSEFLEFLEPWCNNILIDDEMQILTSHYIDKEQKNTLFKLNERIKSTPFESLNNEIIVTINRETFTQQDFQIIQQLPEIIKDSGEIGEFQIENLLITIKQMNEYQNNLIKIQNENNKMS